MPYASVSDVKALAPFVPIDNASKPSAGDVATMIADVEATIETSLAGLGYQTPITGATSLRIVKGIVANTVMAMILRGRPNPEQDPENFQRRADAVMKALQSPGDPLTLSDAETIDAIIKGDRTPGVSSNFRDIALDPDTLITVTRDMKF